MLNWKNFYNSFSVTVFSFFRGNIYIFSNPCYTDFNKNSLWRKICMQDKTVRLIHLLYRILVSVMIGVSGVLLIAACLTIYRSGGEQVYTPEKVAAAFSPVSLPIYITLALIAGSFFLELILPFPQKRPPVQKQHALLLKKQYEKVDMDLCNPELRQRLKHEQALRLLHLLISAGLLIAGCVVFLIYALNGNHFDDHNINHSIISAMWWLLPCAAVPFGYCVFTAYYCRSSIRRELELAKLAPKATTKKESPAPKTDRKMVYIRLAVLGLALGILVGGFVKGGTADVLAKAVAICTECVGLG